MNKINREQIGLLKKEIQNADAIVIGAGAGLSTSAGFVYSGERFDKWFSDYASKYGFKDMYTGGFYVLRLKPEISWAYWARYIYINRYLDAPKPVYNKLFELVKDKDYFVLTTNVDHCFQKAGFDKRRLFYTQGDYGLFQSVNPDMQKTYDNEEWVMKAMEAQGFIVNSEGLFEIPEGGVSMEIPSELIPKCPDDGSDMTTNLRADDSFVEDEGWRRASLAYSKFLEEHEDKHVLYLELGVGGNTPGIIKYPFWRFTFENPNAVYACINYGEAQCPSDIRDRSICIDGDIGQALDELM
ncbi:MAG: hypothetical protein J6O61_18435 [Butyrivibrio sp.]|uniref:SIR2 family NAD-dependent protein deacylase n=1 Tax=Butyrivibrio sp. TaxID=28121 RepID=UPI001B0F7C6E|nr:hypothetical protein [Butyrivibrio sp.]MBO6242781.1 hypothetical protein [Butyrivibrio sp.]